MKHQLNLHPGPFERIKCGLKTIEMRLNDEKRRNISVGDEIEFLNRETNETMVVEVTKIVPYLSFDELYKNNPKGMLGYYENEIADPKDMNVYYSKEQQDKYGVLAIHIRRNDMLKEIIERRSCRNFDPNKKVKDEDIDKIVLAGLMAPSAMNQQDGKIIVIKDKKVRDELMELNKSISGRPGDPFYGGPVVLLVINKKTKFAQYDGSLMMGHMMLEATHLGINNIWIHRAKEELESPRIKEILKDVHLNLDEYEGIGHLVIGYQKENQLSPKVIKDDRVYKI